MTRKVKLFIAMSIDGYIAGKDDDISWLSMVEKEGQDYGYSAFNETIDTYIIGRKTYDVITSFSGGVLPQAEQFDCYVITREARKNENGVTFFHGDIRELIDTIRSKPGKDIYCDGGGEVIRLLLEKNLVDEMTISIIPVLLGEGKRLFPGPAPTIPLEALPPAYFDSGLIQLKYVRFKV